MAVNTRYSTAAPVFADDQATTEIIGHATTEAGALRVARRYFAGTGATPAIVEKCAQELRGRGPVDGWAVFFLRLT